MPPLVILIAGVLAVLVIVAVAVAARFARDEIDQIAVLLWTVWCFLFTIGWRIRFALRNFVAQSALGVLVTVSFYVLLEVILASLRHVPLIADVATAWQLTAISGIPELPWPVEVAALILAVAVVRHHWNEWQINRRQLVLPKAVEGLLMGVDQLLADDQQDPAKRQQYLQSVLDRFKFVLDTHSKRNVAISVMERQVALPDAPLGVTFFHPSSAKFDPDLRLVPGEGGAGKAFAMGVPIYIPSVRHLVGVNALDLRSVGVTYKPSGDGKTYKSLLSVPVTVGPEVVAVLVFASARRSAFGPEDFEIARLAAAFASVSH